MPLSARRRAQRTDDARALRALGIVVLSAGAEDGSVPGIF
ncbi:hypothetical protein GCWU000341_00188 [Oribacterium sp. oral taxon 078 str. F0262]|nr:hypothetical protein GCWU000341_00188 [Oribacterium sp. oral taxon 078 str. F0262]